MRLGKVEQETDGFIASTQKTPSFLILTNPWDINRRRKIMKMNSLKIWVMLGEGRWVRNLMI